jgi:hypothetical protein
MCFSAFPYVRSDSKLLSGFPWPININPDNNLESRCTCISSPAHLILRDLIILMTLNKAYTKYEISHIIFYVLLYVYLLSFRFFLSVCTFFNDNVSTSVPVPWMIVIMGKVVIMTLFKIVWDICLEELGKTTKVLSQR